MEWNNKYIRTLTWGLGIMFFSLLLTFLPWLLLPWLYFLPGFIFGILLVKISPAIKDWENTLFILISGVSYIFCFWIVDIPHGDSPFHSACNLLLASCVGSIILSSAYQLLFLNRWSTYLLFMILLLVGLISAVPGAIVMYCGTRYHEHYDELYTLLFYGGIFAIYPLWQTAFVWVTGLPRFNSATDSVAVTTA